MSDSLFISCNFILGLFHGMQCHKVTSISSGLDSIEDFNAFPQRHKVSLCNELMGKRL